MQETQKRTLITSGIIVLVIAVVYFAFFRGGGSSVQGDFPSEEEMSQYLAQSGVTSEPSKPVVDQPEKPEGDSIGMVAGAGADAVGSTGGSSIGVAAGGIGAQTQAKPEAEVKTPAARPSSKPSASVSEKLLEFRNLDPQQIILDKYADLESRISEPEAFADDIGRVDPLTIVLDYIPEELRPPRSGETNEEEIAKFFEETQGYAIIDSVGIRIDEVLEMGSYTLVRLTISGPFLDEPLSLTTREGGGLRFGRINIFISDASQTKVVCVISVLGRYTTVSRTRTFLSRSY